MSQSFHRKISEVKSSRIMIKSKQNSRKSSIILTRSRMGSSKKINFERGTNFVKHKEDKISDQDIFERLKFPTTKLMNQNDSPRMIKVTSPPAVKHPKIKHVDMISMK